MVPLYFLSICWDLKIQIVRPSLACPQSLGDGNRPPSPNLVPNPLPLVPKGTLEARLKSPGIAESTRRFSGIVFSSSETRTVLGEKAVTNVFQRDGPHII